MFKKKAQAEGAIIVYEDEASFRQTPTLHRTWAKRGHQPLIDTRGQRNTQKIFGAVAASTAQFVWRHQEEYFNVTTYLRFLQENLIPSFYRKGQRIYLIQDNASYHKNDELWDFFKHQRRYIEVFQLPPYSPEFNATERVWNYTRKQSTHNRYFNSPEELCKSLFCTFHMIQKNPEKIQNLVKPFC